MLSLRKSLPLVALLLVADASLFVVPAQVPLLDPATSSAHNMKAALTPEISALAERLLTERGVRGLSTGFVRRDGNRITTEFGAWGNMSEDGDSVRPEVISNNIIPVVVRQAHDGLRRRSSASDLAQRLSL